MKRGGKTIMDELDALIQNVELELETMTARRDELVKCIYDVEQLSDVLITCSEDELAALDNDETSGRLDIWLWRYKRDLKQLLNVTESWVTLMTIYCEVFKHNKTICEIQETLSDKEKLEDLITN